MAGPGLISSNVNVPPVQADLRRLLRTPLREETSSAPTELSIGPSASSGRLLLPEAAQYQQVVRTLETASQNATALRPQRSLPYANLRALQVYESTQESAKRDELSQLLGVDLFV